MGTAHVVNPRGAVHSVNEDWVEALLKEGFRLATEEETATYYAEMGLSYGSENVDDGHNSSNPKNDKRSRSNKPNVD